MRLDLRRALRLAAARPGAWLLLVVTLALGIAAPTLALSLADALLWHPLPFRNADRLVRVRDAVGPDVLRQSPAATRWLADLFPYGIDGATVDAGRGAEGATVGQISPGLFETLGAVPAEGRLFAPDEYTAGSSVVLASAALGAELRAVEPGRHVWTVRVDGVAKTVVGIMPAGFDFPIGRVLLWLPFGTASPLQPSLGLLRPGLTPAALTAAGTADWPGRATVTPFVTVSATIRSGVWAFAGGACLLFIVALVNAAGLQLASAVEQRGEQAVRLMLGASRRQLARAVLVETSLASAAAGALALVITALGLPAIVRAVPYLLAFQSLRPVQLDARAFAIAALASLAAAALAATVSIWRLRRLTPRTAQDAVGVAGGSPARARRVLAALALAVAVPVVASAGLLAESLRRLTTIDPGFRTEGLLEGLLDLPAWRYPTEAARRDALTHLRAALLATSGIAEVTLPATTPPMLDREDLRTFVIDDRPESPEPGAVGTDAVDGTFFDTVGIRILAGRPFDSRDTEGSDRVAIVSRTLAETLWPGSSALGHRFKSSPTGPWRTVVGVAADITAVGPDRARGTRAFYLPSAQTPASSMAAVIMRTRVRDAASVLPAVEATLRAAVPDAPVVDLATEADWLTEDFGRERFMAATVTAIAAAALLLALVGTYAMFRTAVAARTREIGLRMALGATPGRILGAVLAESAFIAVAGLALGLPLAFAATRTLTAWLFNLSPADPATHAVVAVAVLVAAVAAAYGPARRAGRIDPATALRQL